jgi:hypothetical protein
MIVLSLLLLAAESPTEQAINAQAAKCGLPPAQLIWSTDTAGQRRADVSGTGDLSRVPLDKINCLLAWAKRTGAPVGFLAEPPPGLDGSGP